METAQITELEVQPGFDLEEFMDFSQEKRLDGHAIEIMAGYWEDWLKELKALKLTGGSKSWLAIWLPEKVEKIVDEAWAASPQQGYFLNNLAQYICMATVRELLPQVADGGCAPAPKPSPVLREALCRAGLAVPGRDYAVLARRYAVVTYFPFKGGCEICRMREECPKASGNAEFASVVLPGHERGMFGFDMENERK